MTRPLSDAQHESAHVVVGVALGLRFKRAELFGWSLGYTWFYIGKRLLAWHLTIAAGIAYERRAGDEDCARDDRKLLTEAGLDKRAIEALVVAADAILETRRAAHTRVTRALLERDITRRDIQALARGEVVPDHA